MKIKTISKIIVALVIVATILSAVSMVFGVSIPTGDAGATTKLQGPVQRVIGIVQLICYAAAVILIVILGVKFMTASPDGKAEIKKSAIIYVVGAILVFAAGALLNLLKGVGADVVGGTTQG